MAAKSRQPDFLGLSLGMTRRDCETMAHRFPDLLEQMPLGPNRMMFSYGGNKIKWIALDFVRQAPSGCSRIEVGLGEEASSMDYYQKYYTSLLGKKPVGSGPSIIWESKEFKMEVIASKSLHGIAGKVLLISLANSKKGQNLTVPKDRLCFLGACLGMDRSQMAQTIAGMNGYKGLAKIERAKHINGYWEIRDLFRFDSLVISSIHCWFQKAEQCNKITVMLGSKSSSVRDYVWHYSRDLGGVTHRGKDAHKWLRESGQVELNHRYGQMQKVQISLKGAETIATDENILRDRTMWLREDIKQLKEVLVLGVGLGMTRSEAMATAEKQGADSRVNQSDKTVFRSGEGENRLLVTLSFGNAERAHSLLAVKYGGVEFFDEHMLLLNWIFGEPERVTNEKELMREEKLHWSKRIDGGSPKVSITLENNFDRSKGAPDCCILRIDGSTSYLLEPRFLDELNAYKE